MNFKFSPHFAIAVKNYKGAIPFYHDILGLELKLESDREATLKCDDAYFHFEDDVPGLVWFEFSVTDLGAAKEMLIANGCRLKATRTPEGDTGYLVVDPFGLRFHIIEKAE